MKVEICMKYMNGLSRQIHDDTETINDLKFTVNRVENDCLRNKMVLEKDVDHFRGVVNGLSRKVARDKDLHKEKLSPHISDRSYR